MSKLYSLKDYMQVRGSWRSQERGFDEEYVVNVGNLEDEEVLRMVERNRSNSVEMIKKKKVFPTNRNSYEKPYFNQKLKSFNNILKTRRSSQLEFPSIQNTENPSFKINVNSICTPSNIETKSIQKSCKSQIKRNNKFQNQDDEATIDSILNVKMTPFYKEMVKNSRSMSRSFESCSAFDKASGFKEKVRERVKDLNTVKEMPQYYFVTQTKSQSLSPSIREQENLQRFKDQDSLQERLATFVDESGPKVAQTSFPPLINHKELREKEKAKKEILKQAEIKIKDEKEQSDRKIRLDTGDDHTKNLEKVYSYLETKLDSFDSKLEYINDLYSSVNQLTGPLERRIRLQKLKHDYKANKINSIIHNEIKDFEYVLDKVNLNPSIPLETLKKSYKRIKSQHSNKLQKNISKNWKKMNSNNDRLNSQISKSEARKNWQNKQRKN
ncbi:unnamed protein product [Moneuplotes crassus]|uniref:Uncharacterized protein n=1 Tax=Euplotes crassus TaxID=5936 RepID=A0AAD1XQC9_EUPCR|nr:unnamed protein product [Moneuplotes crassus]